MNGFFVSLESNMLDYYDSMYGPGKPEFSMDGELIGYVFNADDDAENDEESN